MIPTVLIGDHVLVDKTAYRWTVPFSEWFSGEPKAIRLKEGPKRGDIVVFQYPRDLTVDYIKRVVGLPGDWVAIKNRKLYINDRLVPTEKASPEDAKRVFVAETMDLYRERLPRGTTGEDGNATAEEAGHWVFYDRNEFISQNFGPVAVPPEQYFMMGDNRDFSNDSRFWGFVPLENIRGRAFRVFVSLWIDFEPFQFDFHPSRTGKKLE